jgi:hypothetical protein
VRVTDSNSDLDLAGLVTAASAIVVDYMDVQDPPLTVDTCPPLVAQAVLLVLAALYEDREGLDDPLGPGALSLLRTSRTPTLS